MNILSTPAISLRDLALSVVAMAAMAMIMPFSVAADSTTVPGSGGQ